MKITTTDNIELRLQFSMKDSVAVIAGDFPAPEEIDDLIEILKIMRGACERAHGREGE